MNIFNLYYAQTFACTPTGIFLQRNKNEDAHAQHLHLKRSSSGQRVLLYTHTCTHTLQEHQGIRCVADRYADIQKMQCSELLTCRPLRLHQSSLSTCLYHFNYDITELCILICICICIYIYIYIYIYTYA